MEAQFTEGHLRENVIHHFPKPSAPKANQLA
jgi:hypothetical protein